MATSGSLLSEDQYLCSICLDVFTEPVTIPCGHNFSMACIRKYWDSNDLCQCPMCLRTFDKRPDLFVNTFISEMVAQFRKSVEVKAPSSPDQSPANPGEVACDVCTGTKLKALKSCLVCLASYCETHLEPHQRVMTFKRHKLIDPVDNLEDRMCQKHQRLPELYCRTDRTCVCVLCIKTDHKTHDTVPIEEEYGETLVKLGRMMTEEQQMMNSNIQKVMEIKQSVEISKREAEKEIADSVQVFTDLVRSIERSQAEFIEVVEEKQKAAERQADVLVEELEQEITELKKRSTEMEQLSHTEDHLHLLQNFPSLCTPAHTKDWSEISVHSDVGVGNLRRALSKLEAALSKEMEREVKKLCDAELRKMQQYSVELTLDSDTARKQVKCRDTRHLPDNPKRFDPVVSVLAKEGFTSGRFYYEVRVKGKTGWAVGVTNESVNRKKRYARTPGDGYWTLCLGLGDECKACENVHVVPLTLKEKPEVVGVFVDYEESYVCFYNVNDRSHIDSFTGCTFTEKVYPYLSAPLSYHISLVNHTD